MQAPISYWWYKFFLFSMIACLLSCKSGPVNLFKPASPHELYQRKLVMAGLDKTAMGSSWISSADQSLMKALAITIPFKETGYFPAEKTPAITYKFRAVQGQQINVILSKNPPDQFIIYLDLWEYSDHAPPKLLKSADTLGATLQMEVKATSVYLLRIQPELLRSGQYTLEITTGPSLGFPVKSTKATIGSYFGDGRDENSRKHEGVDIFDVFHTPVIAAAAGTVVRVNENNLGGRVVLMRPRGEDYTLYYAHLDKQIAKEGQEVLPGDTLGLMGNTGNAKTTPTHLHFGIYAEGGAVNPLPYINPIVKKPSKIEGALSYLNTTARTVNNSAIYQTLEAKPRKAATLRAGTIVQINAASDSWYRVTLPNGLEGFIKYEQVTPTRSPLRKIKVNMGQEVAYDRPDSTAAQKMNLTVGRSVDILGDFENYYLVTLDDRQTGWIKK